MLLSKDFVKCVLVANLIAWPVGYFVADRMLRAYAYRMGLGPEIFVAAGAAALAVALLTVGYQAVVAALGNPSETLRYE
jgi:putative ABC transport system permease protein